MGFCPVPHTDRDQVWIGVGIVAGFGLAKLVSWCMSSTPEAAAPLSIVAVKKEAAKPATKPVLHYFAGRGRAECIRWMLAAADIAFEDPSYTTNQQFEDMKSSGTLLFQQFPVLEMDGMHLTQSRAVVAHVARTANLYGADVFESTRCDMVVNGVCDFEGGTMGFPFVEDKKTRLGELKEMVDKWAPMFQRIISSNARAPFCVGSGLTVADIRLAEVLTGYLELLPGCLDAYPELLALQRHVTALPSVKAYLVSAQRHKLTNAAAFNRYFANVYTVLGRAVPQWVRE